MSNNKRVEVLKKMATENSYLLTHWDAAIREKACDVGARLQQLIEMYSGGEN